ncbi:MAG: AAA family ATPase, partial [Planctomycetales bacterium]|nr:AAA family ATPase [Planctomycetales bacterium]
QFTPDLMPSDITGTDVLEEDAVSGERRFRFVRGPVFTNILLADEINRATPRTQSALLEAMAEGQVSVDGVTHRLPQPFFVIATQNPVEQAGTFELPEAQLDRFMLCHRLIYPTPDEEKEVLRRNAALGVRREEQGAVARTEFDILDDDPVGGPDDLVRAMESVQDVYVSDTFLDHVVEVVGRTRDHRHIELGSSPRAGIALVKAARARALIHDRDFVIPEDLFALAEDVILHRIRLNYEALADGLTGAQVLQELLGEMGAAPARPR